MGCSECIKAPKVSGIRGHEEVIRARGHALRGDADRLGWGEPGDRSGGDWCGRAPANAGRKNGLGFFHV